MVPVEARPEPHITVRDLLDLLGSREPIRLVASVRDVVEYALERRLDLGPSVSFDHAPNIASAPPLDQLGTA